MKEMRDFEGMGARASAPKVKSFTVPQHVKDTFTDFAWFAGCCLTIVVLFWTRG